MQRKDIDEAEFEEIHRDMTESAFSPGDVNIVTGKHPVYGAVILIHAGHSYVAMANDVSLIIGKDDTLEATLTSP